MPNIRFVNEHRDAEASSGESLKSVTERLGIDVHRSPFAGVTCGAWGLCGACQVWVRELQKGAAGGRSLREWFLGMGGQRRLACQVRIAGDLEVVTMAATADRVGQPRPIAPPPAPTVEPGAHKKPVDEAGTAAFPLGHPSCVGSGSPKAAVTGL
jgi:ferredoxin